MKEITGDMWDYHNSGYWVCVLTNGIVNLDGNLVKGGGSALEAAQRFPTLPKIAGQFVYEHGNIINIIPEL